MQRFHYAPARGGRIETLGVDSRGVDYGLLDAGGRLVEDPVCCRDGRTVAHLAGAGLHGSRA